MYKALCKEGIVFRPKVQEEHAFLLENKITFFIENTNVIAFCVFLVVLASRKEGECRWREMSGLNMAGRLNQTTRRQRESKRAAAHYEGQP